jgi:hypothetical protein
MASAAKTPAPKKSAAKKAVKSQKNISVLCIKSSKIFK